MTVRHKLGMILENKMVQNLKLEKNVFNKKWSLKSIFSNEKTFFNPFIFDIKNWQFLHFLKNSHSSKFFFKKSFEYGLKHVGRKVNSKS